MIQRSCLMTIYSGLSNEEKNQWGINSGYSSYDPLYRLLYRYPNATVKDVILNGLKQTVGELRYNQLVSPFINVVPVSNDGNSSNNNTTTLTRLSAEIKRSATQISSCSDINTLEELKNVLEITSDITTNTLNTLELYNRLR